MKCFVTGASGYVGMGVVRALKRRGHEVVGLVRTQSKLASVQAAGAIAVQGELDGDAWLPHAKAADAIVHCAQADYYTKRMSAALEREVGARDHAWVRKLLEAGAGHAKVFVYTSGAWVYGHTGEKEGVDESAPLNPYRAGLFKVEGERIALEEAKRLGYESAVAMRLGSVYGLEGTFGNLILAPMVKGGKSRWIGSGKQFVSLIDVDDSGDAYAAAVEKKPGFVALNICDDEPVRTQEYMAYLAQQMGAKPPGGVPTFVVALVGGQIAEALSSSQRLTNAKAKNLLGWAPAHPTYREGMADLAKRAKATRAAA